MPWEENSVERVELMEPVLVLSPMKLVLVGVVIPALLWLLMEIAVSLIRWVLRGFGNNEPSA